MRACIYTRISDDHTGEGLGVQRQLDDCLALAERLGWEVVARFDDNDISAYNGKTRPGFEAMLDAMKTGEFGALICWHPDRLYRSHEGLGAPHRDRRRRARAAAHCQRRRPRPVHVGRPDAGPHSRVASPARSPSTRGSASAANVQRRAAGKWVRTGLRKFGYTHDGEPIEPEASALRQAADDVLAGKSLRGIAIDWNERGLTTTRGNAFTSLQLRRTLINPLYAGLVTHQDKVVGPGDWHPIIDEDTHRGLVAYLSDPSRRPVVSFERRHMLSGVAMCGICGERAARDVSRRQGPTDDIRVPQRLPPGPARRAAGRLRRDGGVDAICAAPTFTCCCTTAARSTSLSLHTRRAALQARLDDLAAMFAEGAIDGSQLRRGTTELRAQLAGIDSQLAELARRNPVADMFADGEAVEKRWAALSPDMRGKVITSL